MILSLFTTTTEMTPHILQIIPTATILWLLAGVIMLVIIGRLRPGIEKTLMNATSKHHAHVLARIIHFTLVFIACALVASNAFAVNLTSLLATAGIAGMAVAFAAQTSVANIISGLIVLSENTVRIGSKIETNGVRGTIVEINLLSVLIQKEDSSKVRISYKTLLDKPLTIFS